MRTTTENFTSATEMDFATLLEIPNTSTCSILNPDEVPLWKIIIESIIVIFMTCMTIFGNITNMLILRSLPSWGTNTGYFLINLAITDLGVGVFLMSFAIYPTITNLGHWPYGAFLCQLSSYLGCVFCSTSITSLCLISIDRYIAITKALAYYEIMTEKRCYLLIVATWTCFFLGYLPVFFDNIIGVKYNPNSYLCSPNFAEHFYFELAMVVFIVLPCSSIIMTVYSKILLIALHHSKNIHSQEQATLSQQGRRVHKNRKAFRTLFIITGCFTVAWLPYTILSLYRSFQDLCQDSLPHWVEFTLPWMAMSNSFINSIIYFVFNRDYREEALKLFGYKRLSNRNENSSSNTGSQQPRAISNNMQQKNMSNTM